MLTFSGKHKQHCTKVYNLYAHSNIKNTNRIWEVARYWRGKKKG
jgi:hypothetical protein